MPIINAGIQTDFVVDVTTEVIAEQEDHTSGDDNFKLVNIEDFIALFHQYYPNSTAKPQAIWHSLLGNHPAGLEEGTNKGVRYLTTDSCHMILGHYQLFNSGIDFQHLPSGFFLTKNPNGGIRDVLHYSDYLATHNPQTSPLAVVLSVKSQEPLEKDHGFTPPQSLWYEFLRSKMASQSTQYCTEHELKQAFITFSNTLTRLKLDFFVPDFNALNKESHTTVDFSGMVNISTKDREFNPIILLGRWSTILTQPHLKKEDLGKQFAALPDLSLSEGYNALRAITDYSHTEYPCGFVIPEMFNRHNLFHSIRTVDTVRAISSNKEDGWRYIAYQPKRNTIDFYQQGFKTIEAMKIRDYGKMHMLILLLGSTSGKAHIAQTPSEEQNELKVWAALCSLVDNLLTMSLTMRMVSAAFGGTSIQDNFIHHLSRPEELPNIPFLHSMAQCIIEHIGALNVAGVSFDIARGVDPLNSLVILSSKLNHLIHQYHSDFYAGARFYFVNGEWTKLSVQKYIELQDDFDNKYPQAAEVFLPILSTFSIENNQEIETLVASCKDLSYYPHIKYCLSFFRDAETQQTKASLFKMIEDIKKKPVNELTFLPLLEFVKNSFGHSFPAGYFERKKKELLDSEYGLNEEQKQNVRALNLPENQADAIISIESAMVRLNQLITTPQLNQLNEQFVNLIRVLSAADFTSFLDKLEKMREFLPKSPETLGQLIIAISKRRSLEGFNQFYFRNNIEQCNDQSLIAKFILFIDMMKPMGKTTGTINFQTVQDLLAILVLNCDQATTESKDFAGQIQELLDIIKVLSTEHPHIQQHLLDAFNHLSNKQSKDYFTNVMRFAQCIAAIGTILKAGNDEQSQKDMLAIFAVFANYHKKPMQLVQLWDQISVLEEPKQRKFLLNLINKLIENNKSIAGLNVLINILHQQPALFLILEKECANPPYPGIGQINEWLTNNNLAEQYQTFSMLPYGKRRIDFAFNIKEFNSQKEKFVGVEADLFTDEHAKTLNDLLIKNRNAPIHDLRATFNSLREKGSLDKADKIKLLCTCIEMLSRTAAQLDDSIPPKNISQELNTSQVMALYAMLNNPNNKLISEIETGEGKSRIMMILAACQIAQGKTVDFMTSDMALAERDYLVYNAFFTSLDIRTSLISLNTPKQLYQKGGVNFSDNSQLLLLRNRSDIVQDPYSFLDENEQKRCLLIDEVDKFKHDKSKDSYNFAAPSKKLMGYVWVYPLLVNFVRETLEKNPGVEFDATTLTDKFVHFVAINDIDELHKASISSLNNKNKNQLITWLNAANTAINLKVDNDYKVTEDDDAKLFVVRDVEGNTRYTRKVLVLDNGRPVDGSSFSAGVHQCLCAIENQKDNKEGFVIQPENETQRASYPVSFMAQYAKGNIFGASGTSRHAAPASSKEINYEDYSYLIVPRQKVLCREDKNIWLAKDEAQQIEFIKRMFRSKLEQTPKQPILFICKNDQQSKVIYDALHADRDFMSLVGKCSRIHALSDKKEELTAIEEAGTPGSITISTVGMFGRGVDINAANLYVSSAYVPTFEDDKQIKGRTARAGKPGEYRMIVNMSDSDCPLNGSTYNIENEVVKVQQKMALNAVRQEEISKLYADFLENVHQNFLNSLAKKPKFEQLELLETWQKYLNNLQKDWGNQKNQLLETIQQENKDEFIKLFSAFTKKWEEQANFMSESAPAFNGDKANTIYTALLKQKGFFKPERQPLKVQRGYDVADDGQARIYSSLFAQEIAILKGERSLFADFHAWREGRGSLFPDLMATLHGDRPLFANLRATISRLIAELKAWWAGETNDGEELPQQKAADLTNATVEPNLTPANA